MIEDIYDLATAVSNLESLSEQIGDYTATILIHVLEGLLGYIVTYDVITFMFIALMYYHWNNYKLDSKLSLALWIILNTMPIALLYVPIQAIINNYIQGAAGFVVFIVFLTLVFRIAMSMLFRHCRCSKSS